MARNIGWKYSDCRASRKLSLGEVGARRERLDSRLENAPAFALVRLEHVLEKAAALLFVHLLAVSTRQTFVQHILDLDADLGTCLDLLPPAEDENRMKAGK